jgi:hypothetical protein
MVNGSLELRGFARGGLAFGEGSGLALGCAGRLVELAAEALVLGLQVVEASLKGFAARFTGLSSVDPSFRAGRHTAGRFTSARALNPRPPSRIFLTCPDKSYSRGFPAWRS